MDDTFIGKKIHQYKIIRRLGTGGLGEVYEATDTKLERLVALKCLSPSSLSPADERVYLVREARAASAISHPNVCSIYDIIEENGRLFIVMEYIRGRTLRELMNKLPIQQIIDVGAQSASGLAAAHERGIVHLDIKPENIMIRKDGLVQITDFGVAQFVSRQELNDDATHDLTAGSYPYMSPEQIQGWDVDFRSDIFSLGVVLYELVAGEPPFKGWHRAAVEYEIIHVDPPLLHSVNDGIENEMMNIIAECLQKRKEERYQSALEVTKELRRLHRKFERKRLPVVKMPSGRSRKPSDDKGEDGVPSDVASSDHHSANSDASPNRSPLRGAFFRRIIFLLVALGSLAAAIYLTAFFTRAAEGGHPVIEASILAPAGVNFDNSAGNNLSISPNGLYLAFIGDDSAGNSGLYIRKLGSMSSTLLVKADNKAYPFWSPDGKSIAYFRQGKLLSIPFDGGVPVIICRAQGGNGGTWGTKGVIVFSESSTGSLFKVASSGGKPVKLLSPDTVKNQISLRWPYFLPDGNHFLFTVQSSNVTAENNDEIYVSSIKATQDVKPLLTASSNAQYSDGHLFFMRRSVLFARRFDPDAEALDGHIEPVESDVQYSDIDISGSYSTSKSGILIFQRERIPVKKVILTETRGVKSDTLVDMPVFHDARLSPNGKSVAFDSYDSGDKNYDIWTYDISRNVATRLTLDRDADLYPCWAPDGKEIVFSSNRGLSGNLNLYIRNVDGSGQSKPFFRFDNDVIADQWLDNGKYILAQAMDYVGKNSGWDLLLLPEEKGRKPIVLIGTKYDEEDGSISPNSKWVMYTSDESGKRQIYVAAVKGGGSKWQVSDDGGKWSRWGKGGRRIYFLSPENVIMGVKVRGSGKSLIFSKPYPLYSAAKGIKGEEVYYINSDGRKVLVGVSTGNPVPPTVTIVSDWEKTIDGK